MTEPTEGARRRWLRLTLQLLGSGLVLFLLLRHAELDALAEALALVDPRWLLAVLPVKALGLALHELRLYLALRPWTRPSLRGVLGIGFTSGLVNTLLPMRGGDVLAVALIKLECRVGTVAALTAVAATSIIEAVVFGVIFLLLLLTQGPAWAAGAADLVQGSAVRDMSLLTAAAAMGVVGLTVLLRRLHRRDEGAEPRPGVLARLAEAGRGLGAASVVVNTAVALVQVGLLLATMLLLFRALGIAPVPALLAACLIQAGGSMAATALPQTFGAGQAASSVLVLATFGIPTHQALAMAALLWATHQVVVVMLGVVPFWRRLGRISALRRSG